MKYLPILLSLFLLSCTAVNNKEDTPQYDFSITSDWVRLNLNGQVKEMTMYQIHHIDTYCKSVLTFDKSGYITSKWFGGYNYNLSCGEHINLWEYQYAEDKHQGYKIIDMADTQTAIRITERQLLDKNSFKEKVYTSGRKFLESEAIHYLDSKSRYKHSYIKEYHEYNPTQAPDTIERSYVYHDTLFSFTDSIRRNDGKRRHRRYWWRIISTDSLQNITYQQVLDDDLIYNPFVIMEYIQYEYYE